MSARETTGRAGECGRPCAGGRARGRASFGALACVFEACNSSSCLPCAASIGSNSSAGVVVAVAAAALALGLGAAVGAALGLG